MPRVAVGTVADHCDSVDHFGPLATHQGDMKDMQRCWVMKAILATAHPGAKLLEIGAGEPVVAGLLARLGYDVTIIDPYDGCGNGPTSFDHYCSEYPDVRFRREYLNELTVIEPEFDVIYSISVLEHVPLDNMANLFEGVRKASVEGAVYIHAVDHVLRGIGSDYHLDMLTHVAADCHIRASDLADALDFAADDPDTYFLSAEAHNRWRGATPYEQFPMRRCISVQFRGD
ncbi:class I SAM-dependent methyltransferase [Phreatobacter oligotrophus]|uniref:Methyltransferase family protein n=1 Tax=Phreatobacter oligotrophus TaxID=1122261 RepID=A0A2T4YP34_9HYPH|nr:methyltransferase domain-containing protein [Phreatobacter oligotrophus]PTM45281.1 methyltransferase family protein [Phreatobacter oligotrophus]